MLIKKYIPRLPVRKKVHYTGLCRNCDHPVDGKFCSNCGQSVKDFDRPFFAVLFESLSDALSFDNRLLHTLGPLCLRPGFLTQEFMAGRRVKYTPPFRLYLFLTFFAFLLLSHNRTPDENFSDTLTFNNETGEQVHILNFISDLDSVATSQNSIKSDSIKAGRVFSSSQDSLANGLSVHSNIEFGDKPFTRLFEMWKLNPALMMDTALKKLSQILLMILPLFALLLALLYFRQKRYFLEHLLVSLNFHSFIFIVVIISELLWMINLKITTDIAIYLYFIIPIQMLMWLKSYYKQSWFKTVLKFLILSVFYNILLFGGLLYSFLYMLQS